MMRKIMISAWREAPFSRTRMKEQHRSDSILGKGIRMVIDTHSYFRDILFPELTPSFHPSALNPKYLACSTLVPPQVAILISCSPIQDDGK